MYHSLGLLLLDGSVFVCGGEKDDSTGSKFPKLSGEVFKPPYFDAPFQPPVISSASNGIPFSPLTGSPFTFDIDVIRHTMTPIDRVVLLRPASLTHHFDNDQRYIELVVSNVSNQVTIGLETAETLTVETPVDRLGPPGYYMLFILATDGSFRRPSHGQFIRLLGD
jgi:hypothetical protein